MNKKFIHIQKNENKIKIVKFPDIFLLFLTLHPNAQMKRKTKQSKTTPTNQTNKELSISIRTQIVCCVQQTGMCSGRKKRLLEKGCLRSPVLAPGYNVEATIPFLIKSREQRFASI